MYLKYIKNQKKDMNIIHIFFILILILFSNEVGFPPTSLAGLVPNQHEELL